MITIQERILSELKYKIEEHLQASANHQLQAASYRQMRDFVERVYDDEEHRLEAQCVPSIQPRSELK